MKELLSIILILFGFQAVSGQSSSKAKFNLKAGIANYQYADEKDLAIDPKHPSQTIGFDVVLENNNGVFMPGFHYYRVGLNNERVPISEIFNERAYAHYVRIPLAWGYAFNVGKMLSVVPHVGGNASFFITSDDNNVGLFTDNFAGVQGGAQGGVHLKLLSHITLDAIYSHSFSRRIKTRPDSKTRALIFQLGFVF